ncbi:MAG: transketolase [Bacteroidales bacterium]|nr:transketolase [Bacteroidales bacterium]MDD3860357.1 transketolase [Bacteroidales bacterium]
MVSDKISFLQETARKIRELVIKSLTEAGSGHLGGSLGLADVFTSLYFEVLDHDPQNPGMKNRDKLVLSVGHVAPVLYSSLALSGYFPVEELMTLRKLNSRLQGHPSLTAGVPGLETASGSLGQGLSICVGMALADKLDNIERSIYCICGDGELQEGQIWEAVMSASYHQLTSITLIVDRNNVQIDGKTSDVMELDPLRERFGSFGWNVLECDGNNIEDLLFMFQNLNQTKPNVIIAHTVMGKGVPEIEGDYNWHGKAPSNEECKRFLEQLY